MAVDAVIQVQGLAELRRSIIQAKDKELRKRLTAANKTAAQLVVTEALPHIPVRSGRLKSTIKAVGSQASGKARVGSAKVPYAPAIHWGTGPREGRRGPHNIERRPFIYDAAQRIRSQIADAYQREVEDMMDEAVRGR